MAIKLNPSIQIIDDDTKKTHAKASEEYIHIKCTYGSQTWDGWIPKEYRRTGISLKNEEEVNKHLNAVYEQLNPQNLAAWLSEQTEFWAKKRAETTQSFFDTLAKGGWKCTKCAFPPNPNPARRIQDLKEFGYTIATDKNRYCPHCNEHTTHRLLIPIKREEIAGNGYETWSQTLRNRILSVLGNFDVYECTKRPHLLPDHKFSEIRWDSTTKSKNPDTMTDEEIRQKFQLLSNQRNQQKREVCRTCFQTGNRGVIHGIPYFYKGTETWDDSIPKTGKEAEAGCQGCAWYDISEWKKHLIAQLKKD